MTPLTPAAVQALAQQAASAPAHLDPTLVQQVCQEWVDAQAHNHELAEMLAGRTTVEAFTAKHGMFDLTIGDVGAQIIAESMIQLFKTGGATNFLTFKAITLEGDYTFTIQKATGITPEEKYAQMCVTLEQATSALAAARAALEAVEWVTLEDPNEEGKCPWCRRWENRGVHASDCQRQAALGLAGETTR